jgi:endonuclease G, mitochondrial
MHCRIGAILPAVGGRAMVWGRWRGRGAIARRAADGLAIARVNRLVMPMIASVMGLGLVGCGEFFADLAELMDWPALASPHLMLGNPSEAATRTDMPQNYLIIKPQFALSYNRDRGTANWVSWQLNGDWLGEMERQDDFRPDPELPPGWPEVSAQTYRGSGYDRGHMAPSGDRTASRADNSATFVMSNMVPQAPGNNRGPWNDLENYCRDLVRQGQELYIIAGPAGQKRRIGPAAVVAPQSVWKVIVVLEQPGLDVGQVSEATRVIAVNMPNESAIEMQPWRSFVTSVDEIEALTNFDFLSKVDSDVQAVIEARLDGL